MPTPSKNESQKDFINRCVPILVKEGREQKQALAICFSMWKNRHKKKDKGSFASLTLGFSEYVAGLENDTEFVTDE